MTPFEGVHMTLSQTIRSKVTKLLSWYDWVVINTSGGKDSQTMLRFVVRLCEQHNIPLSKVVAVHADLGEEEWEGVRELAQKQAGPYGVRFEVVKRKQGSLLQHVLDRRKRLDEQGKHDTPAWMSSTNRFCTSDHKRDQVALLLTRLGKETRKVTSRRARILNCMGMRSGESSCRSKLTPFKLNRRASNGRRVVHDWLPIFDWTEEQVWGDIRNSAVPYHAIYDRGMPRLSCCFCIYAPYNALLLAGHLNTPLLRQYVEVEKKVRSTFREELPLAQILADVEAGKQPARIKTWEMP
jgi:3'-phosphoadenosine 5'-phosphosulfate sulfotransferase (PAPS reductase)/FAD synthetase